MRLALKKTGISRYQKRSGNILVTVEKQPYSGVWVGSIENMTHWAKSMCGRDVEMSEELFSYIAGTKKEAYAALESYILYN